MTRKCALFLFFTLLSSFIAADNLLEVAGFIGYHSPNDARFESTYDKGMTNYGGFFTIKLWKILKVTGGFSHASKTGKGEYSDAEFTLDSISLGARVAFPFKTLAPYVGTGFLFLKYNEVTSYYEVPDDKKSATGYYLEGGAQIKVFKLVFIELGAIYTFLKAQPFDIEVDLGGFGARIGIGIRIL